jgi:L-iditol 2-dehydrogenase
VARRKGLTLAVVRRMGDVSSRALALVERGVVDVASLVSASYGLPDVAEAFAAASARTGLKVVVEVPG